MPPKFKCALCGDIITGGRARYTCKKHKFICGDHVRSGWFGGNPKCTVCEKVVIRYDYNWNRERWEKA